ncbi:hypothetical protein LguiA_030399 [Lonicera macranthoides]
MSIYSCNNCRSPAFFLMFFFLNQLIFVYKNVLEKIVFTLVVCEGKKYELELQKNPLSPLH